MYDCETCSFLGLVLPTPENLRVDVWDGEAAAHWSHPTNAPAGFRYNVEMAKYVSSGSAFVSYSLLSASFLKRNLVFLLTRYKNK